MKTNRRIACSGLAALLAATVSGPEAAADSALPGQILRWEDPDVVARGSEIYDAQCASCHGSDLEGQADWRERLPNGRLPAPPHDETGHTWHHADILLVAITTLGTAALVGGDYESDMTGFGDALSPDEIVAVLSYIKSTWPQEVIEIHNDINARDAAARGG